MEQNAIDAMVTQAGDGAAHAQVPDGWMQGRTLFGGITAALAVRAMRTVLQITAPLRSLQVAFVAPVSTGALSFDVRWLRQGRSVSFAHAMVPAAEGAALLATGVFGAARTSALAIDGPPMPPVLDPDALGAASPAPGDGPDFLRQLDIRWAGGSPPFSGGTTPAALAWVRLRDPACRTGESALVTLGDALPPPATGLLDAPAPLSSISWSMDFPGADLTTREGWWLLQSVARFADDGFQGQDMALWSRDGRLVAIGRQNVAIFA